MAGRAMKALYIHYHQLPKTRLQCARHTGKKEVRGHEGFIQRFFCPAQNKRISHSQYELTQTLEI